MTHFAVISLLIGLTTATAVLKRATAYYNSEEFLRKKALKLFVLDANKKIKSSELISAFDQFLSIIGGKGTGNFFEDYKSLGDLLFTPETLLASAKKSTENKRAIQIVLFFMGFPVGVRNESIESFAEDLKQIAEARSPTYWDEDEFAERLFGIADLDRNGYIDVKELETLLHDLKLFSTSVAEPEQAKQVFSKYDRGTGKITEEDFKELLFKEVLKQ